MKCFKDDFTLGSYYYVEEKSSDDTTGKATIIVEGIAVCSFKDDNSETRTLNIKIACPPMSKYRLMASQWLGIQEKDKGAPKDKRSTCRVYDEEAVLTFDDRRRKVTIKYDPKMLVPVLNINPGVKHFQSFNVAFNNIIKKKHCRMI